MKTKTTLTLFGLVTYSTFAFSIELDVMPRLVDHSSNIRDFNEARHLLKSREKNIDTRKAINNKRLKYRSYNQFNNKAEYEIGDGCNGSSSDEACASSRILSIGTTSSYIGEYSMYAVVGSGIKLPENQIESYDGIDD